ncbi:MAG TPA: GNAT family N-acetyltransferase [Drouetiella sp.]|jgi:RimJ/RimL family protein N-acetyltransferase
MSMTVLPGTVMPMCVQQSNDEDSGVAVDAGGVRGFEAIEIAEATVADLEVIYQMSVALAMYERKSAGEILLTRQKLAKWAFGPNKVFSALIARKGGQPVGMAVYYYAYAGSLGAPILYIEDLFVERLYRGRGVATSMLRALVLKASEFGCCRVQGAVFNWNENAAACYEKLGAQIRRDLHQVRLESSRFSRFLKNDYV